MTLASASFAGASLAALPAAEACALDLRATAGMLACFVTSKAAEARAEAAAMSRRLADVRGIEAWAAAVNAECKPAVARGLLKGLADAPAEATTAAAAAAPEAEAAAGPADAAPLAFPMSPGGGGGGGGGAVGLSPSLGARVPSLAQYLRERSSQRRRRSGLPERLGEAALAPMGPFSPSALGASARRGRMSKSPVLVLKREQMLESEGAGGGGGGGGSNDALIEVADENDGC